MVGGKTLWVLSLFWLAAIPSVTDAQVPGEGVTDSTIRIGILGSLTGPASNDGRDLVDGLQSYLRHTNDTGGIHGRGITIRVHDDRSNPDHGLREARRMVAEEGIFAIACTSGIVTMQALLDRGMFSDQIPVLAGAALSRSLFGHYRRNVFFFGMPYEAQVALVIESLMTRSPGLVPKMGVLAPDDVLGEDCLLYTSPSPRD